MGMASDDHPFSHAEIQAHLLPNEWEPAKVIIAERHNTVARGLGEVHQRLHSAIGVTESEMDESNKVLLAGRKIAHWMIKKGGWLVLAPMATACLTFTGKMLGFDLSWVAKAVTHFIAGP